MVKPKKSEPESGTREQTPVERWISEIKAAERMFREWWELVEKIEKRYIDERASKDGQRKYNVLWSTMQTLQPLVYSSPPSPYVSRRHSDRDPAGRDASLILQRALAFTLDGDEMHDALTAARDDYLLSSRGVIWNKYTPYFQLRTSEQKTRVTPDTDRKDLKKREIEVEEDDEGEYYHDSYQDKVFEEVDTEHVYYKDFLHGAASKWRHVPWVARKVPMTRKELVKRFGNEMGRKPPLTIGAQTAERAADRNVTDDSKGMYAKAEVWEIWVKDGRCVYWLCPDYKDAFLDEQEDILGLDGFFPCPQPAYGTKTNKSLVPTPDYKLWQDIALELDDVTLRMSLLTDALRVAGVYDDTMAPALKKVLKETRKNEMIPVSNWALFAEKGGLKNSMEFVPIEQIMVVLDKLTVSRTRLVQELYEITGIADIIRGASDPRETAKAQQIKGNFASKRLETRQEAIARTARESLEIQAQVICGHYSDDYIRQISSAEQILVDPTTQQYDPRRFDAALAILRNAPLRRFRIKIDEHSLAAGDLNEDQQQRTQFTQGVSQLLSAALPLVEKFPAAAPMVGEILLFAVRGFPQARSTEAAIEDAIQKFVGAPPPAQQQDAPAATGKSPQEIAVLQGKLDLDRERLGLDKQRLLNDERFDKMKLQLDQMGMQLQAQNRERESAIRENKAATDTQVRVAEIGQRREESQQRMTHERESQAMQAQNENAALAMQDRRERDSMAQQAAEGEAARKNQVEVAFARRPPGGARNGARP